MQSYLPIMRSYYNMFKSRANAIRVAGVVVVAIAIVVDISEIRRRNNAT